MQNEGYLVVFQFCDPKGPAQVPSEGSDEPLLALLSRNL